MKPDRKVNFERLSLLLPTIKKIKNKKVEGDYYLSLTSAYRSIKNLDSANFYEKEAVEIFQEQNDFEQLSKIFRIRSIQNKKKAFIGITKAIDT